MTLLPEIDDLRVPRARRLRRRRPEVFALEDIADVVGDGPDEVIAAAARACPRAPSW